MKPEVVPSPQAANRRRRYSQEFKQQVVKATLVPGASVARIALEHRLNTNVVFKWRRAHLRSLATSVAKVPKMLPVLVDATSNEARQHASAETKHPHVATLWESIEIKLCEARVLLKGANSIEALRSVLEALAKR